MRRISTFFYGIGQGIKNIFRNRMFSLASVCTMAACLFLFGLFFIFLSNFEYIVKEAETNVGITVFFDEGTTEKEIFDVRDKIEKRAEVYRTEYTSAEDAWADYKENKLTPELAASFGTDNPLKDSASLTVFLNDVSMQDSLVKYVSGIEKVRKCNDASDLAGSLSGINKAIAIVSGILIFVLLAVATFLISITISTGVSVRRQEISIMKLIGASNHFIRIPFVVEGVLIGAVGAGIPIIILKLSYDRVTGILTSEFSSIFNLVSFMEESEVMKTLIPVTLIIGIGIGLLGSTVTLKRQLRKIEVH